MAERLLFIVNPTAGKKRIAGFLSEILQVFCSAGYLPTVLMTERGGHATELVRQYGADCGLIVCAGGDGTLNETVSGMLAAGIEVVELISLSAKGGKIIVDTNIPLDLLHEISDYDHVAVMLSPQSMSVERFFDRSDPEKRFLLDVIEGCPDSAAVMENYRRGLARINSREHYEEFAMSGFFTLVREDTDRDTREEVCEKLAKHFGLTD